MLSPITSSNSETKRSNNSLYTHPFPKLTSNNFHSIDRSIPRSSIACLAFQGNEMEVYCFALQPTLWEPQNHNSYNDQPPKKIFNLGGFSIHHDRRPHVSINLCQFFASSFGSFTEWVEMDSGHLLSKTISSPSKTLSIFRLWRLAPKRKYFAVQQHVLDLGSSSCIFTRPVPSSCFFFEWQTFAPGWHININQEHGVAEFFWDFKSPIIWGKKYLLESFAIF